MIILFVAIAIIIYLLVDIVYLDYFKYKKFAAETVEDIEAKLKNNAKRIKDQELIFRQNFQCRKCGKKTADTDILSLQSKEYSKISSKKPHKFLKATCKSCGFSNLYNLNLQLKSDNVDPLPPDMDKYGSYFELLENFTCPVCQANEGDLKSVFVKRRGISRLVNFQLNELLVLSCKKCFYSQFFDSEFLIEHKAMEESS